MRRRLLLNLLLRPLLILWVQLDLVLVHCPSINGDNLEGETNKQVEVAHAEAQMYQKSMEFNMQGCTLTVKGAGSDK